MGLAGRKEKQRIGVDPRNLTWSDDKSRFSYQHMKNLGWRDSQGIGRELEGNPNHIAVVKRSDNAGIGAGKGGEGSDVRGQSFEEVLRRLTGSAEGSPAPSPLPAAQVEAQVEVVTTEAKVMGRVASRNKHRQSKKLITSSPAALAEILGVPVGSLTPTPISTPVSPSPLASPALTPGPATETPPEKKDENPTDISTSTLSVQDYFRAKMKERARLRQNPPTEPAVADVLSEETPEVSGTTADASGSSTPAASGDPAVSREEARAAKRAKKEAKAKRKAEALDAVDTTSLPSTTPQFSAASAAATGDSQSMDEEKAAKRARKEEKEARREAKRLKKAAKGAP